MVPAGKTVSRPGIVVSSLAMRSANFSHRLFLFSHSSSHLRLVFFFRVVLSPPFDKRPPHILEHLVGLVGGEFVALDLGAQAHPQRVQRVEGRIVGIAWRCALPSPATRSHRHNGSGITQESKSAIKCWCYEQHQHCNNPCNGNVPHWLTVSQHADELCEFSAPLRPTFRTIPCAVSSIRRCPGPDGCGNPLRRGSCRRVAIW